MELKQPTWAGTSWTELLLKSRTLAEGPQAHTSSGMALNILKYKNNGKKLTHGRILTNFYGFNKSMKVRIFILFVIDKL